MTIPQSEYACCLRAFTWNLTIDCFVVHRLVSTTSSPFRWLAKSTLQRLQTTGGYSRITSSAWFLLTNLFVSDALSAHRIMEFRCFSDARADAEHGIVTVAAIFLENGEVLFLDPRNTFGVRMGNRTDLDEWIRLNVSDGAIYREFTW